MPTDADWPALIATLRRHPCGPRLTEATISSFERRVGFALPAVLRNLYLSLGNGFPPCFLPLMTGREDWELDPAVDPAEAFARASEAFASVLGWHESRDVAQSRDDDDDVWVDDLLVVADYGCAVYFALDLADTNLRVIEYEHFAPSDKPELAAQRDGVTLAYTDDRVPRAFRLRFTVAAPSLHEWLSRWTLHGDAALRATWTAVAPHAARTN